MATAAVLIYLCVLGVVAIRQIHRVRTGASFLLADRGLTAPALASTLLAAWIGAGSLFSNAGLAYRAGFAALWVSAGAWAGMAIVWHLAPRVRATGQSTVPAILREHYGRAAGIAAAIVIIVAFTAIAAMQFAAGGRLLNLVSGIEPSAGTVLTAVVCIGIAAAGGLTSVTRADMVNAAVIVVGFATAAVYLGGLDRAGFAAVRADQLTIFGTIDPFVAVALFVPVLGMVLGDAGMYQKLAAARDESALGRGIGLWLAATALVEILIVTVAVLGSAALPDLDAVASDTIVLRLALSVLPSAPAILLLAAATAIVVSAATTFLLAAATCVMRDFVHHHAPLESDRLVWPSRYAIAAIAVLGLALLQLFPSGLAVGLWAFTLYGALITPPLLIALLKTPLSATSPSSSPSSSESERS